MGEPDGTGRFGGFGGQFVPESLMPALQELDRAFREAWADPAFRAELDGLLADYAGRPSPLTECHRLSGELGVRILFKREDLNHTGSHKINNVLGQALLARRMGKSRLVAETGAGQHGVATATAAALMGMECLVYMGEVDMARQELNVFRMRLLGAEVTPALSGSRTLKDAVNEAMRDWVATVEHSHYCLGSVMGPHPYPWMVREFHRVIGTEAHAQSRDLLDGGLPDVVVACVGGGSNAAGIFSGFAEEPGVELVGVEPAGGAAVGHGVPGIVHGMKTLPAAGRVRPGPGGAVDLGRARLPGRRAGALAPGRLRPGPLRAGVGPGGHRRLRAVLPPGGHHPGPGAGARPGMGVPGTQCPGGSHGAGEHVRPGRQGRGPDDGRPPGRALVTARS